MGNPVLVAENGDLYVGGSTLGNFGNKMAGQGDAFIGKFTEEGEELWVRQFGRDKWDAVMNVVFTKDGSGDILISGCQNWDHCEGYVRRYTSEGAFIWNMEIASNRDKGSSCGKDVVTGENGGIYHVGGTNDSVFADNLGGQDCYVVKFREHQK